MASVADYLEAQKRARGSVETLARIVRQAYDAAQATTNDGTYDCLDVLENSAARTTFSDTLIDKLTEPIRGAIGGFPEDPISGEALAMNAFYGFTGEFIGSFVDGERSNISLEGFMEAIANPEYTGYKRVQSIRQRTALTVLSQVSASDVLNHTGVSVRDPSMITLKDKAELIGLKEQHGVVPPNYLTGKPYM